MRGRGACVAVGACVAGGACMAGGHVFQGHAWQGCLHGRGACMARGHAWQGGMRGRGACVAVCFLLQCILVENLWDAGKPLVGHL